MKQTKIISPVLTQELIDNADCTEEEIDLYMSFLEKKCIEKKEHFLQAGDISHAIVYVNKSYLDRYIIDNHMKEIKQEVA